MNYIILANDCDRKIILKDHRLNSRTIGSKIHLRDLNKKQLCHGDDIDKQLMLQKEFVNNCKAFISEWNDNFKQEIIDEIKYVFNFFEDREITLYKKKECLLYLYKIDEDKVVVVSKKQFMKYHDCDSDYILYAYTKFVPETHTKEDWEDKFACFYSISKLNLRKVMSMLNYYMPQHFFKTDIKEIKQYNIPRNATLEEEADIKAAYENNEDNEHMHVYTINSTRRVLSNVIDYGFFMVDFDIHARGDKSFKYQKCKEKHKQECYELIDKLGIKPTFMLETDGLQGWFKLDSSFDFNSESKNHKSVSAVHSLGMLFNQVLNSVDKRFDANVGDATRLGRIIGGVSYKHTYHDIKVTNVDKQYSSSSTFSWDFFCDFIKQHGDGEALIKLDIILKNKTRSFNLKKEYEKRVQKKVRIGKLPLSKLAKQHLKDFKHGRVNACKKWFDMANKENAGTRFVIDSRGIEAIKDYKELSVIWDDFPIWSILDRDRDEEYKTPMFGKENHYCRAPHFEYANNTGYFDASFGISAFHTARDIYARLCGMALNEVDKMLMKILDISKASKADHTALIWDKQIEEISSMHLNKTKKWLVKKGYKLLIAFCRDRAFTNANNRLKHNCYIVTCADFNEFLKRPEIQHTYQYEYTSRLSEIIIQFLTLTGLISTVNVSGEVLGINSEYCLRVCMFKEVPVEHIEDAIRFMSKKGRKAKTNLLYSHVAKKNWRNILGDEFVDSLTKITQDDVLKESVKAEMKHEETLQKLHDDTVMREDINKYTQEVSDAINLLKSDYKQYDSKSLAEIEECFIQRWNCYLENLKSPLSKKARVYANPENMKVVTSKTLHSLRSLLTVLDEVIAKRKQEEDREVRIKQVNALMIAAQIKLNMFVHDTLQKRLESIRLRC